MAYETGRHVIGYEVDEVRAAVDWFTRDGRAEAADRRRRPRRRGADRPLRGGGRPADRRGLGRRLLRAARGGLVGADLPERLGPARRVRRRRGRQPDRAPGADDRGVPGPRGRRPAPARERPERRRLGPARPRPRPRPSRPSSTDSIEITYQGHGGPSLRS